jgi:Putative prokaryotic signal transducing protein
VSTEPWTRVESFLRIDEARLLAGRLNAEGIPARTDPEDVLNTYGTVTGALLSHGIDVLVPNDRAAEARKLIERIAADG